MDETRDKKDDFRSGKEQTSDELHRMYKEMTDPEEIEKARLKKMRNENVQEQIEDNGF